MPVLVVPDPCDWFAAPPTKKASPQDYLDTYAVLAEAAAELKCAATTLIATRSIPEAMLDTALARLDAASAAVRAIKERTT